MVGYEEVDGIVEIDGRGYTLAEAEAEGYPIACQWFIMCDQPAAVFLAHPILTAVPTCKRCAEKCRQLA